MKQDWIYPTDILINYTPVCKKNVWETNKEQKE